MYKQAPSFQTKINLKEDVDDKVLRQKIIGKYGYVDQEEDARYHRPIIKKEVLFNYLYTFVVVFE